jgi:signal transduction histidine kinase
LAGRDGAQGYGPASSPGPGVPGDAWERGRWIWDAAFYVVLALATAASFAGEHQPPQQALLIVGLAVALAGWHAGFTRLRVEARPSLVGPLVYVAGLYALWFALLSLNLAFFFMLWVLYPWTFRLLPLRVAIGAALVLTALTAARQFTMTEMSVGERAANTAYVVVAATSGILLAIWINRIISQSAERKELIDELTATRRELAVAERQAGMLEERQRLAREIHDTLAQGFTSIVLLLQAAEAAWASGSADARRHLEQARRTAAENLAEARQLVWALQPEPLGDASLGEALARLTDRLAEEERVEAATRITGTPRPLPTPTEVALLRITQEALTNVRRHAHAGRVTVTLSYMDDVAVLDVQDDGVGFDPRAAGQAARADEGGFGLAAIRQRVDRLGGSLVLESAPGAGTTLVVELPVDGVAGADPPSTGGLPLRSLSPPDPPDDQKGVTP